MDNRVPNIESVIKNLKQEKEGALVALNKVREELNFGEDLLKLRGDRIRLINEVAALRLDVEGLEKAKKKDFLISIRDEILEFEAKKRSLGLEVNELISAISEFKSEKILLNKTLDEISQQIVQDKNISDDAIRKAFQEIEAQESRIVKRVSEVSKRESEVKGKEKEAKKKQKELDEQESDIEVSKEFILKKAKKLRNEVDRSREEANISLRELGKKKDIYRDKVAKKEMEFSVWEDNLKMKTQELKEKFEKAELSLKEIEKAKVKIKKGTEDLKLSWEEYKRQNNILKKRGK